MSTTQKRQKTLNTTFSNKLIASKILKSKVNYTVYLGCLCIALIMVSISGSAQLGPITVNPTTLNPITLNPTTITPTTFTPATFTPATTTFGPITPPTTPCNIDDWTALKALYESTDGDNWKNRDGWDEIIAGQNAPPYDCDLRDLYGVFTYTPDAHSRVIRISLSNNNLKGSLPPEMESLYAIQEIYLRNNNLNGVIPASFNNLYLLKTLVLTNNNLSGAIPSFFKDFIFLQIQENRFTCDEINQLLSTRFIPPYNYSPQKIQYSFEPFIADTNQVNNLNLIFPFSDYASTLGGIPFAYYRWLKNGNNTSLGANSTVAMLNFTAVTPTNSGIYKLHIESPCNQDLVFISDPLYIIYPGYDFEGQPVEYNQIMVEFDDSESTEEYKDEILLPHGGQVIDQCNCNRELYLWQFPNTVDAMDALIEIDGKSTNTSNSDGDVDGGLNNVVRIVGSNEVFTHGHNIELPEGYNQARSGEVSIFILDTGLDKHFCLEDQHLLDEAPMDACYEGTITPTHGYSYTGDEGVDHNFQDDHGHGTFGYDLMSEGFQYTPNIDIVPLKIFNSEGQGNLFDLTCAIYHAIDHGADIINISAGYYGQSSSIFEKAINTARELEVFICTAAGNEGINIDTLPQYPASYAGLYHYEFDEQGEIADSIPYSNVISVASLSSDASLSQYSNVGENSVSLSCYGESLNGEGLDCFSKVLSGTSMATFVVSRFLAMEIANDDSRPMGQILSDFDNSMLISDANLVEHTLTGKRLNVNSVYELNESNGKVKYADENLNASIDHVSTEKALLKYRANSNGRVHISLYDANGRYVQPLFNDQVNKGKQHLDLNKKTLEQGMYFIHLKYQPEDGIEIYQVLKLPILH